MLLLLNHHTVKRRCLLWYFIWQRRIFSCQLMELLRPRLSHASCSRHAKAALRNRFMMNGFKEQVKTSASSFIPLLVLPTKILNMAKMSRYPPACGAASPMMEMLMTTTSKSSRHLLPRKTQSLSAQQPISLLGGSVAALHHYWDIFLTAELSFGSRATPKRYICCPRALLTAFQYLPMA